MPTVTAPSAQPRYAPLPLYWCQDPGHHTRSVVGVMSLISREDPSEQLNASFRSTQLTLDTRKNKWGEGGRCDIDNIIHGISFDL